MKNYISGFALDYEDVKAAINRPQNMRLYVPEGSYHAVIVDAFAAPNSRLDGMNLVVDFSIHAPDNKYHGWVMRKYFSLTRPGYELQLLTQGMEGGMNIGAFIGRVYTVHVSRQVSTRGITSEIAGLSYYNMTVPESMQKVIDLLYDFIEPMDKIVLKRELSVDYYKPLYSTFKLEGPDNELVPGIAHTPSRNWMLTHVMGHNLLKMAPPSNKWLIAYFTNEWTFDLFEKMVVIESDGVRYALIGGVTRKEAEKTCRDVGVRLPLPSKTPIPLPWCGLNLTRSKLVNPDAGDTIQDQIEYLRKVLM